MQIDRAQLACLEKLGIVGQAARAYGALLRSGPAEASVVAAAGGIPSPKVYATLERLHERGLVTVAHGRPRKYAAVPLSDFIDRQVEEHQEKIRLLREGKSETLARFAEAERMELPDRSVVVSASGRRNVLRRFEEACGLARDDIFVAAVPDLTARRHPLLAHLTRAAKRGVDVHVLPQGLAQLERESSPHGETHVAIATFDHDLALFVRLAPGAAAAAEGPREVVIGTKDAAFVRPLRAILALHCGAPTPAAQREADDVSVLPLGTGIDAGLRASF